MTRWAIALRALDYRIQHRPGADIGHADFLSRLPLSSGASGYSPEPAGVFLLEANVPDVLAAESIAQETKKDPLLQQVLRWTSRGWPASVPQALTPYFNRRNSISRGCLLFGDRVVVPDALRVQVTKLIHATHPGIVCSKQIARSIAWWPRIDADLEAAVRLCEPCQLAAKLPSKAKPVPWPAALRPWERIHLDYAGPFMGHYFLIAVDSYSKWPVIRLVPNLSSDTLITVLRYMFADFGRPHTIVTDNGRSFISAKTKAFLERNGVKLLHTPPMAPLQQRVGRAYHWHLQAPHAALFRGHPLQDGEDLVGDADEAFRSHRQVPG